MIKIIIVISLLFGLTNTSTTVAFNKNSKPEIDFSTYISQFLSNQFNKMLIVSTVSKFLGIQSTFKASNFISLQPHNIRKRNTEILNITAKLNHILGYNKIVTSYINKDTNPDQYNQQQTLIETINETLTIAQNLSTIPTLQPIFNSLDLNSENNETFYDLTSYYQTKIDAVIFALVRFYNSAENTISKITRTNIFKFLLNINKLQTHLSERKKRQTKTFTFPRQPKQLIQQIDALDETIKKYEHNLHLLSNSFKSILPKFHETFDSTLYKGRKLMAHFTHQKAMNKL